MKYKIDVTDIYKYKIEVEADNPKDAIEKAKECYQECEDGVIGVADATSYEETEFRIIEEVK